MPFASVVVAGGTPLTATVTPDKTAVENASLTSPVRVPGPFTMKMLPEVPVPADVVTVIVPLGAKLGTVTVSDVVDATVTTAVTPPNLTVLFAGVGLKSVPVIITVVPAVPVVGEKLVTVGNGGAGGVTIPPADPLPVITGPGPQALRKIVAKRLNSNNTFFIKIP
jgi:hypothetical protein